MDQEKKDVEEIKSMREVDTDLTSEGLKKSPSPLNKNIIISGILGIIAIVIVAIVIIASSSDAPQDEGDMLVFKVEPTTAPPTTAPTEPIEEPTQPTEPAWVYGEILDWILPYYEENQSVTGWIRLPGTVIDYPIYVSGPEYTGRSHEPYFNFYLTSNRDGSRGDGEIYIWPDHMNGDVGIHDAEILFIFGHNFRYFHNGEIHRGPDGNIRQFSELPFFENEDFFNEHKEVILSTLYNPEIIYEAAWVLELDYVVDAQGYAWIHFVDPDTREIAPSHFHFLQTRQFASETDFDVFVEAMNNYSIVSSGDVEYGDRFIFLLTCQTRSYISSRRLVLVARYRSEQ